MKVTKFSDITHLKHEVDAKEQVLGRFSTQIVSLLTGKSKPYFTRHLDCGDFVTVKNAKEIKVTGKKREQKLYTHYSGFAGGLKTRKFKEVQKSNPAEIIRHAVWGMLPNNKLRDIWIKRLKIS